MKNNTAILMLFCKHEHKPTNRHFTHPVKRKTFLFVASALSVFCVVYAFQPVQSVAYAAFEPRFDATIRTAGFRKLELASCSGELVSLPLRIRLRHLSLNTFSGIHAAINFPDSAEHYTLVTEGSPSFDCYVRYLDSRATLIAIRASTAQESIARALRSALEREFPGVTISLTTNDA